MPNDQNSSQGRRPHYHRGRRGGDRRGSERRTPPNSAEASQRNDHVEVEQIMREIRSRIAKRHGIDLSSQQIQELAARRLEAILEPRHLKPALLEQMRRAAGEPIEVPAPPPTAQAGFQEDDLYTSHRGIVRWLRKVLNPILKLFINPTPIARALDAQVQRQNEAAAREAEFYARQAEWNALHYELLQRLVIEVSRNSLEVQNLTLRVESLATRVDFNERRVRSVEHTGHQPQQRPSSRAVEAPAPGDREREPRQQPTTGEAPQTPLGSGDVPAAAAAGEGTRRRRRRRRGRRSGGGAAGEAGAIAADGSQAGADGDADLENETDIDDTEPQALDQAPVPGPEADTAASPEPAQTFSLVQPVEPLLVEPQTADVTIVEVTKVEPAWDTTTQAPPETETSTDPLPDPPASVDATSEPIEAPPPATDDRNDPGPHGR